MTYVYKAMHPLKMEKRRILTGLGQKGTVELQFSVQGAKIEGIGATFEQAFSIKIFKTPISLSYPLNYVRVRTSHFFVRAPTATKESHSNSLV